MKHEALDRSTFESLTLVELAAKAIGLKGEWSSTFEYIEKRNAGALIQRWNPLTNNSDALRLAAQLDIEIAFDRYYSTAQCLDSMGFGTVKFVERNSDFGCQSAAICSAIVRAAAHLGVNTVD